MHASLPRSCCSFQPVSFGSSQLPGNSQARVKNRGRTCAGFRGPGSGVRAVWLLTAQRLRPRPRSSMCVLSLLLLLLFSLLSAAFPSARCVWPGQPASAGSHTHTLKPTLTQSHTHTHSRVQKRSKHIPDRNPPENPCTHVTQAHKHLQGMLEK